MRKVEEGEVTCDLCVFLTTEPNAEVGAVHPDRPIMMTDAAKTIVWEAVYKPFGEVYSVSGPASQDARFPGQWLWDRDRASL